MEGLERFIKAQEQTYDIALQEVRSGRKHSHWIWFIFPQLKGLGHSYYSNYYGIDGLEEAKAYLCHPILGAWLREITAALYSLPEERTARSILGGIDAIKVKSSMTLFYLASKEQLFLDVLNRYYKGELDEKTNSLIVER